MKSIYCHYDILQHSLQGVLNYSLEDQAVYLSLQLQNSFVFLHPSDFHAISLMMILNTIMHMSGRKPGLTHNIAHSFTDTGTQLEFFLCFFCRVYVYRSCPCRV